MQKAALQIIAQAETHKLPTLPHVLLHLLEACQDENVSFEKLANIVRYDPALYLKIVFACNRDCAGTNNLEESLDQLGLHTVKTIAITSAVQQHFSRSDRRRNAFLKQHWRHAIMCGCLAERLARHHGYEHPEEAWFAGLVHDAGQLVLEAAYPDAFASAPPDSGEQHNVDAIERAQFDTTHNDVGAHLFISRKNNPLLADAIMYHHEPLAKILDAHPLVKIVNLANQLSQDQPEDTSEQTLNAAKQLLGLSASQIDNLTRDCSAQIEKVLDEYDVELNHDDADVSYNIVALDRSKQDQLASQIRNIAMLDGVHQHLSRIQGKRALLQALQRNISVLFGINDCILFLYSAADDNIQTLSTLENEARFQHVKIPLEPGRSIVTDALLELRALHTFERQQAQLSVLDRQLIGLQNREGLFCLPLISQNAAIGSLVLGIDQANLPALMNQQGLLRRFATELASTISVSLIEFRDEQDIQETPDIEKILKTRAREVIHEAANPLSIINNYLEILSIQLEGDDPAQQDLETIRSEIHRVSTILENLSRPSKAELDASKTASVDINALIADLSHMFQTSLFGTHEIDLVLDLDEDMPRMTTNADAIKQIYTNLIKNAVEALPAEGQIMVYTQDKVNVDGKIHVEICVADDGPGIPAEILPDLFSPAATKKGEGHAGLGLTIVKNLVKELHGSISCRSSEKGTSFHILLPRNIRKL